MYIPERVLAQGPLFLTFYRDFLKDFMLFWQTDLMAGIFVPVIILGSYPPVSCCQGMGRTDDFV